MAEASSLGGKINDLYYRWSFNARTRIQVYDKIGNYVNAGMGLSGGIAQLYIIMSRDGKKPNNPVAVILRKWRAGLADGQQFSDIIAAWVPESERAIVASSEDSDLPRAVVNLTRIYDAKSAIRGAIVSQLSYPAFLFGLGCLFLIIFAKVIAPQFNDIMPREKWGFAPALLADAGDFLFAYGIPTLIGMAAAGVVISLSMPRWTGMIRRYFDKVPPWSVYNIYQGTSFMLMLSAMRSAGLTDSQALGIMLRHASPWLAERLRPAQHLVSDGAHIGDAVYQTGMQFPDEATVLDMRSYARLPDFPSALERTGVKWLEGAVSRIKKQMVVLKYCGMLFATFVIVGFLLAVASLAIQMGTTTKW